MIERVYRDPVHGAIAFDPKTEAFAINLIDSKELQRLRRIKQLGGAYFVFHGAEHSRFAHSVGVAHIAKRMFNRLRGDENFPDTNGLDSEEIRKAIIASALLHDIGHGPFSHLFERIFRKKTHEDWGLEIIEDTDTEVHAVLKGEGLVDLVRKMFEKNFKPRFAWDIISSQLDADRFDYLLRDSYMTGVAYGRYDLDWLLENIELATLPTNGLGLAINYRKGRYAAEQFVIARYLMYQQVYFHKTIRAAEGMIKNIFKRLRDNAISGKYPKYCPAPLQHLLDPDERKLSLQSYLRLDDEFMLTCFGAWANDDEEDHILSDLSFRVINRRLFKVVEVGPDESRDDFEYSNAIQ